MQWWCAAQGVPWTWEWQPYPGVWLFIAALGVGYALLRRGGAARDREAPDAAAMAPPPGPHGSPAAFGAGLLVLWIALDWPVGALGAGYLASVHMVQFLLIALLAPPLLLLGVPHHAYRTFDARGGPGLRAATHPLTTLAAFTGVMALTHWPPLVDALMVDQLGSFALDTVWLTSGILFWWPVVAPVPDRPWLRQPLKMGYLIAATVLNTGVFAYLTFSGMPLYATFELAPPVSGLSTRDDQLVAGLLMKMGGAVILWTSITILFFRWVAQQEQEDVPSHAPGTA
ncbi:MAG: cytochrome c oxidase assembly protein [Gemmatimonadetes bacterium]|nr:cytochrome c oxidase assembly protein [Gemmatimonadota bacterium]